MSRPAGSDGPEDVDAAFEEIVADLRASGFGDSDPKPSDPKPHDKPEPRDKSERESGPEEPEPEPKPAAETDRPATGSGWREGGTSWEDTMLGAPPPGSPDDDEHYVPPDPPPLPKPRKGAFVVLLFFVVGLLLLIAPGLIGLSGRIGTPLGLFALAVGIALLLLRVKQGPPDGADPSNGAQV